MGMDFKKLILQYIQGTLVFNVVFKMAEANLDRCAVEVTFNDKLNHILTSVVSKQMIYHPYKKSRLSTITTILVPPLTSTSPLCLFLGTAAGSLHLWHPGSCGQFRPALALYWVTGPTVDYSWQAEGWNWKTVGWLASRIRLAVWEVDYLAGWLASLCASRSVGSSAWLCVHMAVLAEIKRTVQSLAHSQHNKHSCGNMERLSHQTHLKIMTIYCGLALEQKYIVHAILLKSISEMIGATPSSGKRINKATLIAITFQLFLLDCLIAP